MLDRKLDCESLVLPSRKLPALYGNFIVDMDLNLGSFLLFLCRVPEGIIDLET